MTLTGPPLFNQLVSLALAYNVDILAAMSPLHCFITEHKLILMNFDNALGNQYKEANRTFFASCSMDYVDLKQQIKKTNQTAVVLMWSLIAV